MRYDVVTYPADVLRGPTTRIAHFSAELKQLVADMRVCMHDNRGVGLAAPQIGKSLKLAVIEYDPQRFEDSDPADQSIPFLAIFNPVITSYGKEIETFQEGCLSLPELVMDVPRSTEVSVLAQSLTGERIRLRARGFFARILQHEIDHLNRLLIIDRTTDRKIRKKFRPLKNQAGANNHPGSHRV